PGRSCRREGPPCWRRGCTATWPRPPPPRRACASRASRFRSRRRRRPRRAGPGRGSGGCGALVRHRASRALGNSSSALHQRASWSDCPDLTALPASARAIVDQERFGGLTACDTRRVVYGTQRRAILTYSPELHQSQARGFTGTTLAKAGKKLDDLAATLARGKTRRRRAKVEAEITAITRKPWVRRVVTWQLTGEQPRDLRLSWGIDPDA